MHQVHVAAGGYSKDKETASVSRQRSSTWSGREDDTITLCTGAVNLVIGASTAPESLGVRVKVWQEQTLRYNSPKEMMAKV